MREILLLPYLSVVDLVDQTLYGSFAILGVGQCLYKPEFAVFDEFGIETATGDMSFICVDMTGKDKEVIAFLLLGSMEL